MCYSLLLLFSPETVELHFFLDYVFHTRKEYWECWKEIICELPPVSRRRSKLAQTPKLPARAEFWSCWLGGRGSRDWDLCPLPTFHTPDSETRNTAEGWQGAWGNGYSTTDVIWILIEVQGISDLFLDVCWNMGKIHTPFPCLVSVTPKTSVSLIRV